MLFLAAWRGTREHIGIDLSAAGVEKARCRAVKMPRGRYRFLCGGVETLEEIGDGWADALVLSNIVDNLYPEDAHRALAQARRILRAGGRLFLKLNPYLTGEQIREWHIRVIRDNVLDDGLILWNNTTEEWERILGRYFSVVRLLDVYYEEHDQHNRLFLAEKK